MESVAITEFAPNLQHLGSLLGQVVEGGDFWMPEQASTTAAGIDWVFYFILGLSIFFFALIVILMTYFGWKYRAKPGEDAEESPSHNTTLEVTWTIIPTILVVFIFYVGFTGYLDAYTAPSDAYEIQVTAGNYAWTFAYPNGVQSKHLVVPAGENVRLVMQSTDFIHSLYVPAFRVKRDVVPGRTTTTWFNAPRPTFDPAADWDGSEWESHPFHRLFCTEYCGYGHSTMYAQVHIYEEADFSTWLLYMKKQMETDDPVERGAQIYNRLCSNCHWNGDPEVQRFDAAPPFMNFFSREHEMVGSTGPFSFDPGVLDINYDAESPANSRLGGVRESEFYQYIARSIREPSNEIVAGPWTAMGLFPQLGEDDYYAMYWYLMSLSTEPVPGTDVVPASLVETMQQIRLQGAESEEAGAEGEAQTQPADEAGMPGDGADSNASETTSAAGNGTEGDDTAATESE